MLTKNEKDHVLVILRRRNDVSRRLNVIKSTIATIIIQLLQKQEILMIIIM